MRMTRPIDLDDGEEDDVSSESQDKREQDLTMLHYIRNMPETIKFNQHIKNKKKNQQADDTSNYWDYSNNDDEEQSDMSASEFNDDSDTISQ